MKNKYHILVKEMCDHHFKEWSGYLTLFPQENGETYLDVSFSDESVFHAYQDQTQSCDKSDLSIEFIDVMPADL